MKTLWKNVEKGHPHGPLAARARETTKILIAPADGMIWQMAAKRWTTGLTQARKTFLAHIRQPTRSRMKNEGEEGKKVRQRKTLADAGEITSNSKDATGHFTRRSIECGEMRFLAHPE
jgi:hypothetical protein